MCGSVLRGALRVPGWSGLWLWYGCSKVFSHKVSSIIGFYYIYIFVINEFLKGEILVGDSRGICSGLLLLF